MAREIVFSLVSFYLADTSASTDAIGTGGYEDLAQKASGQSNRIFRLEEFSFYYGGHSLG